jgi:Domain of unknown function (DUF5668)
MKNRNTLFWGVALITLGGLFLVGRTGGLPGLDHEFVNRFWPVFFILGGLALVLRQRESSSVWVITALLAVAAPVTLYALVTDGRAHRNYSMNFRDDDNSNDDSEDEDEADTDDNDSDDEASTDSDYDRDRSNRDSTSETHRLTTNTFVETMTADTRQATLKLEGGAARFRIDAPGSDLIRAEARTTLGSYVMSVERDETTRTPTVRLKPTEGKIEIHDNLKIDNRVTLHLNATPVWTMNIDMGAGTGDFDLSPYQISNLSLNAGVADIDVKLGDKAPQSTVKIDAGVASVVVRVPKSVGVRIVNKGELNAEQLDDFVKDTNGSLVSPGYNASTKKIDLTYEGGLSRFKVVRY